MAHPDSDETLTFDFWTVQVFDCGSLFLFGGNVLSV